MCAYSSIADLNASFYHASQVYSNLIQKLSNKVLKNCRKLWYRYDEVHSANDETDHYCEKKVFLPPFSAPKTFVRLPIKSKLGLKIDQVFTVDIFEAFMFSWIFFDGSQYWSFSVHNIESWLKVIKTRWKIYQHGRHTYSTYANELSSLRIFCKAQTSCAKSALLRSPTRYIVWGRTICPAHYGTKLFLKSNFNFLKKHVWNDTRYFLLQFQAQMIREILNSTSKIFWPQCGRDTL